MPSRSTIPRRTAVAITLSAVLLAACNDDPAAAPPPSSAPDQPATVEDDPAAAPLPSSAPDRPATVEVDWAARTVTGTADGGVVVEFCEGDSPYLCFTSDGEHVGVLGLLNYPVAEHVVITEVVAAGGDESDALERMADDFVAGMAADRVEGCGPDYRVVADEPAPAVVAGEDGLRYGFRGVVDGTTVEHVVLHALIDDDTLWILNAAGYDDGGCLGREGEFDIGGLETAAPLIGELAAGSRLPAPDREVTNGG